MIKKIFLLSVVISQLTISCSKDEPAVAEETLDAQITAIMNSPYSTLTPAQQKVKMEGEANEMLTTLNDTKKSEAIDVIESLENLMSISNLDITSKKTGKKASTLEDILQVSDTYATYTWNNTKNDWVKTPSTTELKFIFPAIKGSANNNAILTAKGVSSTTKVEDVTLPSSVEATLKIGEKTIATINSSAKYSEGSQTHPTEVVFKMTLDGFNWEMNAKKGVTSIAGAKLSYKEKSLIEFSSGSTANIDELLKDNYLTKYLGTANGFIKLMDNFVIVADVNIEGLTNDEEALDNSLVYPNYNSNTYYSDLNIYNKKYSEGSVLANNKNVKMILVSKKDGTKIADVIQKSVKGDSYNTGTTIVQHYDEVLFLKFNDSTENEMSAYFSTGFENLNTKFEDFLKGFERN
jgi:hypothetical protein